MNSSSSEKSVCSGTSKVVSSAYLNSSLTVRDKAYWPIGLRYILLADTVCVQWLSRNSQNEWGMVIAHTAGKMPKIARPNMITAIVVGDRMHVQLSFSARYTLKGQFISSIHGDQISNWLGYHLVLTYLYIAINIAFVRHVLWICEKTIWDIGITSATATNWKVGMDFPTIGPFHIFKG